MRDINISPCKWHMRIWDVENNEWLCDKGEDALPYYGFDIRGGEVTAIQGMSAVYDAFAHGKEFIWEQSTGLKDKNGKEIYEGDIIQCHLSPISSTIFTGVVEFRPGCIMFKNFADGGAYAFNFLGAIEAVIGNIHENPELLEGEK